MTDLRVVNDDAHPSPDAQQDPRDTLAGVQAALEAGVASEFQFHELLRVVRGVACELDALYVEWLPPHAREVLREQRGVLRHVCDVLDPS